MLSKETIDLSKVDKKDIDKEILRLGIIAELDAVNLYEQMSAMTKNQDIKKILSDIAKEEKTHVGEFQALLLELDKEQLKEIDKAKKEVKELTKR
ncbi:MAG TPA: ferritin family protein [Candidatus Nanoarchaeia archaeon]|nr:ferritin family protein [Candidatus Nanoarchaeia archaeon]